MKVNRSWLLAIIIIIVIIVFWYIKIYQKKHIWFNLHRNTVIIFHKQDRPIDLLVNK